MRPLLSIAALVMLLGAAGAAAQTTGAPGSQSAPESQAAPLSPSAPMSQSFGPNLPALPARQVTVYVSAAFAGDGKPIRSGLIWRVYEDRGNAAQPVIVTRSTEPAPSFTLPPGNYIVHAAYGFAGTSKRISLQSGPDTQKLTISAGALKLAGAVAETPIPASQISFAVYVPVGSDSEGRLVVPNAHAGDIIRLPEGTYHVVSTYGDANAIMRTDLKVENGRVTEATLNHRAATVTLKLVASAGAEAFAGTAFSVLTPGGDIIREAIGAFPSVTLAEGDYVLIARHEGQVYTREFKVESGSNRDVEIVVPASQ